MQPMPRLALVFAAFFLAATAVRAQTPPTAYYKSTMPDGQVIFGNAPEPGAKEVKKVPLKQGNTIPSPENTEGGNLGDSGDKNAARRQALDDAEARVAAAQKALDQAQAALAANQEPQPGERIGTAGGYSRLKDSYFQRIQSYQDAVNQASRELDTATRERDAARGQ